MADGSGTGIEELYRNFGTLADAGTEVGKHTAAYERILKAAKGSTSEKKLAPGFITRFFRHFPSLADSAMDAMLDLIEDEDAQIRRSAIKSLPDICKGSSDSSLVTRVADVLTQLLPTEEATDLSLVKSSMAAVLQVDTQGALAGIFGQITGEDETVREKGIEYVSTSLLSMRHKLFLTNQENEKFLVEQIKKVLADVSGEEFETFMEVLSKLTYLTTPEGVQEITTLISEQAELSSEFKVKLSFSPEALYAIAEQAVDKKIGARGLRAILEKLLLDPMFEVPGSTVTTVHITEEVVRGTTAPCYEHSDPVQQQDIQSSDTDSPEEESSVQL